MKIKAHPTAYSGVQFRSRLEARWAAFFDLCGKQWEYEPIDFAGWSPDFRLITPFCAVYAEVKPVAPIDQMVDLQAFRLPPNKDFQKARDHWNQCQVLLLGSRPQISPGDFFGFGTLLDPPPEREERYSWVELNEYLSHERSDALWREAGNKVQWLPKPGR